MSGLEVGRSDGIVTVAFNRPERRNAIGVEDWTRLDQVLEEVGSHPEDRVLVLQGRGGNFSSGADLSGNSGRASGQKTSGFAGGPPGSVLSEMRYMGRILSKLHALPKPSLAVVDGDALGVGLGLALACDLIIASNRARFGEVFVRRGLGIDGGSSWTLPRAIGLHRAKEMCFFGDFVNAEKALEWGLVNAVVDPDDLERTGIEWAQRLASGPTTALSLIKRLLDSGLNSTFEQALEDEARTQHVASTTADVQEGMRAFFEKRRPEFKGM